LSSSRKKTLTERGTEHCGGRSDGKEGRQIYERKELIDHIDEGIMQIEVVDPGTLALQFDVRGAEDPESMERLLDAFDGAEVKREKKAATGTVTLSIRGAGGPPRIQW
jgi:hypothetical protein